MGNKIRFEVFKRDGFTCQYCGRTPPSAILEADHINPRSNHGKTTMENLITSCRDCNKGKGKHKLTSIPSSLKDTMADIEERELQIQEYNKLLTLVDKRLNSSVKRFREHLKEIDAMAYDMEFKGSLLKSYFRKLPETEVIDAADIAVEKLLSGDIYNSYNMIKYFCGVCRNKINGTKAPYEKEASK